MAMSATKESNETKRNSTKNGRIIFLLYGTVLCIYIFTIVVHKMMVHGVRAKQYSPAYEKLDIMEKFKNYFFTGWNFGLQIVFLLLAVIDEASKLANISNIHKRIEPVRLFLFSTFVFPSTLIVVTVFWAIWHVDRELIFPKVIDNYYPSWLNHALHTLILLPLAIEVLLQFKNKALKLSKTSALIVFSVYLIFYQTLYMSVYIQHGIWLYPIYKVLSWPQRGLFSIAQLILGVLYQQIGIYLVQANTVPRRKIK